ncbi:MAG: Rne/Rng family ribonuclease [Xanthobacteraceae bacterium]
MANKMLIDATHPEETRVVVLRGNRVEEFDFESAHRKQLRGNIYLAKVTRVEPSLQAAFVDYGGNRHGFLAFSEIHPDYYQIPVADRQALIDEEERAQRAADDEVDRRVRRHRGHGSSAARRDDVARGEIIEGTTVDAAGSEPTEAAAEHEEAADHSEIETVGGEATPSVDASALETPTPESSLLEASVAEALSHEDLQAGASADEAVGDAPNELTAEAAAPRPADEAGRVEAVELETVEVETGGFGESLAAPNEADAAVAAAEARTAEDNGEEDEAAEEIVESVGGSDALEEVPDRAPRYRRQYKIQEVIKRRQVMLVQVVKEERGTKGAALTTYLSLAGRYSVLMPNTARGGGISRKITNADDRARLKEAAAELEVPEGMGVILRTAGAARSKIEIKRDFEYLLRMWETVRDLTLKSTAPKLVYEEGSLVKRSLRDLYSKDIDEVTVAGADAYHEAKEFMRMLMPSHAKNVKLYADTQPLLSRYGVENQLDAMFSPVVQLRSGGYIVLNQAEALVAIDVNSGRATREHHIEDTAFKTNLEAADEIARQLRLRDLAGLIVIDFIDMDEKRNNRTVERRLKECLKHDRARIQVGRISHFGLLEMSRQRIRTSVLESSTEKCPYCGGSGHVRSVSSLALQVLRALEEHLIKGATHNLIARTRPDVALYVLNQKRAHLRSLEERFAITITVSADETVKAPQAFIIDRGELVHTIEAAKALAERTQAVAAPLEEEDDLENFATTAEDEAEAEAAVNAASSEQTEGGSRRRHRRRRRGGRNGDHFHGQSQEQAEHIPITEGAGDIAAQDQNGPTDEGFGGSGDEPDAKPRDEMDDQPSGESFGNASGNLAAQERAEANPQRRDDRRRRRGRRGGRRNRQRNDDSYANHEPSAQPTESTEFDPAQQIASLPAAEAGLKSAIADLDTVPLHSPPAGEPPAAMTPEPMATEVPTEPPRRRSTVRERAPLGGSNSEEITTKIETQSAPPAPEPTVTETNSAPESERPRRSGWWSRRFAGG